MDDTLNLKTDTPTLLWQHIVYIYCFIYIVYSRGGDSVCMWESLRADRHAHSCGGPPVYGCRRPRTHLPSGGGGGSRGLCWRGSGWEAICALHFCVHACVCVSALRNMSLTVELIPYRMCSLAFRAQALLVSRSLFHRALAWDRDEHVLTVLSV